ENEDTLDQRTVSYSSWGNCEFNAGTGGISGRTTYGSSLAPGETMKYPILYYGGNAHCRIITNGRLSEYQYPDDDTLIPTAQGALDAYEDFVKKVMNCSEDAPAVADWRDDGAEVRTEFNGYRSEENREDDIEMTVEIQEN
ncbi:MAG: hypothetical protein J6Y54_00905, partial [Lentisphaeria bacterium]|nr:hypothetical protein [Lentisphaeria bacterium]